MNDHGVQDLKAAWEALDRDDFRFAETSARAALVRAPQDAEAHYLLGSTMLFQGRLQEALPALLAAATRLQTRGVGYRLGHCHFGLGHLAAAENAFRGEIHAWPDYANAHNALGTVLAAQGQNEQALAEFMATLALDANHAEAVVNAGNALQALGRSAEALPYLQRAVAAQPGLAQAWQSLGLAFHALHRFEEAAASFGRACAIEPHLPYALSSQVWAALHACDWREIGPRIAALRAQVREGRVPASPFTLVAVTGSPAELLQVAQLYVHESGLGERPPLSRPARAARQRLRVAYVSSDFHNHATAQLMARLFEIHDRRDFELIAFSYGPDDRSAMRARLERAFDRFVDAERTTDLQAAHMLAELDVDIAVDLKGLTAFSRMQILAWRPAPVQVTYLGYPATAGVPYIDYVLADRIAVPPEQQPFFTEKLVYLPDTYQVNDDRVAIADRTPSRAELGLPENAFVFCAFNNAYKLRPDTFQVWMRLLTAVPHSVLWLFGHNPEMERNVRESAQAAGVAPSRVLFAPRMPLADHLARHRQADVFLDTLPYNAHTTASDALRMGLPVVTCLGETFAGRVAASLLHAVGLPELVTRNLADYEALALRLARDPQALAALRAKLQANVATQPLFDTARFCRHLEAAYRTMWERHLRGEAPAAFAVPPIS